MLKTNKTNQIARNTNTTQQSLLHLEHVAESEPQQDAADGDAGLVHKCKATGRALQRGSVLQSIVDCLLHGVGHPVVGVEAVEPRNRKARRRIGNESMSQTYASKTQGKGQEKGCNLFEQQKSGPFVSDDAAHEHSHSRAIGEKIQLVVFFHKVFLHSPHPTYKHTKSKSIT